MGYVERVMEKRVRDASGSFPVVALCGMRGSGKRTMLERIAEEGRTRVSLADDAERRLAERDPALFLETYRTPLDIEEFQLVPSLSLELKYAVDERLLVGDESVYGAYRLTSSQRFPAIRGLTESMAGRCAVLDMSPLSAAEIDGRDPGPFRPDGDSMRKRADEAPKRSLYDVYGRIFEGGMPAAALGQVPRGEAFGSFMREYLERDAGEIFKGGVPDGFAEFVSCVAARTGQELDCERLADMLGLKTRTVRDWLSVLEDTGLVYVVRPFYDGFMKKRARGDRVYFADTGLCSYLTRYHTAEALLRGPMAEAMLETYAVNEIVKSYRNAGRRLHLCCCGGGRGAWSGLVIRERDTVYPIEIRMATCVRDTAGKARGPENTGLDVMPTAIICLADRFLPRDRQSFYFPVYAL